MQNPVAIAFAVLGTLLVVAVFAFVALWNRYEKLLAEHEDSVDAARKESVARSRNTLKGQISEQMAPMLPDFPYGPADCRFLGNPIDYLVFDGYSEFGNPESEDPELEIVLLEIKQNQSQLSPVQRAIRRAVEEGRVRFELARVDDDGNVMMEKGRSGKQRAGM